MSREWKAQRMGKCREIRPEGLYAANPKAPYPLDSRVVSQSISSSVNCVSWSGEHLTSCRGRILQTIKCNAIVTEAWDVAGRKIWTQICGLDAPVICFISLHTICHYSLWHLITSNMAPSTEWKYILNHVFENIIPLSFDFAIFNCLLLSHPSQSWCFLLSDQIPRSKSSVFHTENFTF